MPITFCLQHLVLVIKIILAYVIPDSPNNLRVQLQRERQTVREAQFQLDQQNQLPKPKHLSTLQKENFEADEETLNRLSAASLLRNRSTSVTACVTPQAWE